VEPSGVHPRKVDGQGEAGPGQLPHLLARGHGGAHPQAGKGHRLGHLRAGQGEAQAGGQGKGRGDPRDHLHPHPKRLQGLPFLPEGPVEARVAGVEPDHHSSLPGPLGKEGHDLLQDQPLGVHPLRLWGELQKHPFGKEASRIEDEAGLAEEPCRPHGEEVRLPRPPTHHVHLHQSPRRVQ